jgi:peptidoglycan biosynthesis protein MviN/MurJ (putative lipid II flippase)
VKVVTGPMFWSGELLLFWYYSLVLTHEVFKNMFMMAGQEKKMMQQGVIEAAFNLVLSIGLTFWFKYAFGVRWGILGVALGSVIPTFVFGWGFIWGWAAKEAGLGRRELFAQVIAKTWLASIPMAVVAAALRFQPFWASGSNTFRMIMESSVVVAFGLVCLWRIALSPGERASFGAKIGRKLGRKLGPPKKGRTP